MDERPQHVIGFNVGGNETSKSVSIDIVRETVDVLDRIGNKYIAEDGSLYNLYVHFLGCSEREDSHILVKESFDYIKSKCGKGFRGPITFDIGIKGRPSKALIKLARAISYETADVAFSCYTLRTTLERAKDILREGDRIANFATYKLSCLGVPVEPPCDISDVTDLIVEAAKWGIHYIWLISPCRFWCEHIEIKDVSGLLAIYEKLYHWYLEFKKYNRGIVVYPFSELEIGTANKPVSTVSMFVDGDRNIYHCGSLMRQERLLAKLDDPKLEEYLIHKYEPLKMCEKCPAFGICCMCWTVVTRWEKPCEENPFCTVMKHLCNISKV